MEPIELKFLSTKPKPGKAPGYVIVSNRLADSLMVQNVTPKQFATDVLWWAENYLAEANTAELARDFSCKQRVCIACKDLLALTAVYAVIFMKARSYGIEIKINPDLAMLPGV